jgi:hypothetical protein
MRITYTHSSALGGNTEYELLLDEDDGWARFGHDQLLGKRPFEFRTGFFVASNKLGEEDARVAYLYKNANRVSLERRQIDRITSALSALHIGVAQDSNAVAFTVDGWSGDLEIDSMDFSCRLGWFLDPPPAWRGVKELVALLESLRR